MLPRPLVAILEGTSADVAPYYLRSFEQVMREQGHIDGQTVDLAHKFADGDASRYPTLAEELIGLKPTVLVTGSTTALACRRLAATNSHCLGESNGSNRGRSYFQPCQAWGQCHGRRHLPGGTAG